MSRNKQSKRSAYRRVLCSIPIPTIYLKILYAWEKNKVKAKIVYGKFLSKLLCNSLLTFMLNEEDDDTEYFDIYHIYHSLIFFFITYFMHTVKKDNGNKPITKL